MVGQGLVHARTSGYVAGMLWEVQEAASRLSEVLRAVEGGAPQVVGRGGQPVAVLIDIASYRHLTGAGPGLADHLRHGPTFDGLDLEGMRHEEPRLPGRTE